MAWVCFIAFLVYNKTKINECCLSFMNPHKGKNVCVHDYLDVQCTCIMFMESLHNRNKCHICIVPTSEDF